MEIPTDHLGSLSFAEDWKFGSVLNTSQSDNENNYNSIIIDGEEFAVLDFIKIVHNDRPQVAQIVSIFCETISNSPKSSLHLYTTETDNQNYITTQHEIFPTDEYLEVSCLDSEFSKENVLYFEETEYPKELEELNCYCIRVSQGQDIPIQNPTIQPKKCVKKVSKENIISTYQEKNESFSNIHQNTTRSQHIPLNQTQIIKSNVNIPSSGNSEHRTEENKENDKYYETRKPKTHPFSPKHERESSVNASPLPSYFLKSSHSESKRVSPNSERRSHRSNSEYDNSHRSDSGTCISNIIVKGLPFNCSHEQLHKIASKYGNVIKINIPEWNTGENKGYGFVQFAEFREAKYAVSKLNNYVWQDHPLQVELSKKVGCFKCGNYGHIAKNCTARTAPCEKYGRFGHRSDNFRSLRTSEETNIPNHTKERENFKNLPEIHTYSIPCIWKGRIIHSGIEVCNVAATNVSSNVVINAVLPNTFDISIRTSLTEFALHIFERRGAILHFQSQITEQYDALMKFSKYLKNESRVGVVQLPYEKVLYIIPSCGVLVEFAQRTVGKEVEEDSHSLYGIILLSSKRQIITQNEEGNKRRKM